MKRKPLIAAWAISIGLFFFLTVAFLGLMFLSRSPINERNFARIQNGMTLEQVEEILGSPPVDRNPDQLEPLWWLYAVAFDEGSSDHYWVHGSVQIGVVLNENCKVVSSHCEVRPSSSLDHFRQISRWLFG